MDHNQFIETEDVVDINKLITKYIAQWPFILGFLILSLLLAFLYIQFTPKQYQSKTTLKFEKKGSDAVSLPGVLQNLDLGIGLGGSDEINSEAAIITSHPLLGRVVDNLNLSTQIYSSSNLKNIELYKNSPISATIISLNQPKKFGSVEYEVKSIIDNQIQLIDKDDHIITVSFDIPTKLPFGIVKFHKNLYNLNNFKNLKVVFRNPFNVVQELEGSVTTITPADKGFLLDIILVGSIPEKSEDILNEISKMYNLVGLEDKKLQAENTQKFIDKRLSIITKELSGVENQKEDFQARNQIVNIEEQAKLALQNTSENTRTLLTLQTQLELLNTLTNEVNQRKSQLIPSNLGLNPTLESTISNYNDLVVERDKTLKQATGENPYVVELERKISILKNNIIDNLEQQKTFVHNNIAQLNQQIDQSHSIVNKVPTQSKIFRGIERNQTLKEHLYLYLMQKREENAINLSVNIPKAKIINPAYTLGGPISPKKYIVLIGSLIVGLLLPITLLFVRFTLNKKIYNVDDIREVSKIGVIGEIPKAKKETIIKPNEISPLAESYRSLVSNLKFVMSIKQKSTVILVTSSSKGEGKTTTAINLALTLGNKNHKSLIIGADIRNPQLSKFDNDTNHDHIGLSNYLYDNDLSIDQLVFPSQINPECDVIYSGSIPPNPQELLSNGRFQKLIEKLKEQYQYIIIDSAPLVLVSDTLHIADTADVTLYIVRSGKTAKNLIKLTNELVKDKKLNNVSLVLNAMHQLNKNYGYYYGYGYQNDDKKRNWWQSLFK